MCMQEGVRACMDARMELACVRRRCGEPRRALLHPVLQQYRSRHLRDLGVDHVLLAWWCVQHTCHTLYCSSTDLTICETLGSIMYW